jgi:dTDP-4-amino-4,6-dideoxygalactose transaminase
MKEEIRAAVDEVIGAAEFINGPKVADFGESLRHYMRVGHVALCGNGTDALRLALQAVGGRPGDEVIMPAFTYIAPAEAAVALGMVPVPVDVDGGTFNLDVAQLERAVSPRTRAILPVHLFGQACDMEGVMRFAAAKRLFVVEDNAQSLGAEYTFSDGKRLMAGAIGHLGITSFFPSKPLGCYGDGGAVMARVSMLGFYAEIRANHGQVIEKYIHTMVGCNSRLDSIQAAVLEVKMRYMGRDAERRRLLARRYDEAFAGVEGLTVPVRSAASTHVFHQYTLRVAAGRRNGLRGYLADRGIASAVYYPRPVHRQPGYAGLVRTAGDLPVAEALCDEVLSLPMSAGLREHEQDEIIETVIEYLKS